VQRLVATTVQAHLTDQAPTQAHLNQRWIDSRGYSAAASVVVRALAILGAMTLRQRYQRREPLHPYVNGDLTYAAQFPARKAYTRHGGGGSTMQGERGRKVGRKNEERKSDYSPPPIHTPPPPPPRSTGPAPSRKRHALSAIICLPTHLIYPSLSTHQTYTATFQFTTHFLFPGLSGEPHHVPLILCKRRPPVVIAGHDYRINSLIGPNLY